MCACTNRLLLLQTLYYFHAHTIFATIDVPSSRICVVAVDLAWRLARAFAAGLAWSLPSFLSSFLPSDLALGFALDFASGFTLRYIHLHLATIIYIRSGFKMEGI